MKRILSLFATVAAVSLFASELPLDIKPVALEVYGLRGAYATAPNTVVAVMGPTGAWGMRTVNGWRIVSEEDPAYAYEKFIKPTDVKITRTEEEIALPEGFSAPEVGTCKLLRNEVTLQLPFPLKPDCTYGLVSQGEGGNPATSAKSGTWFSGEVVAEGKIAADALVPDIVGLRRVSNVGDGKIVLEFGAGFSESAGNDASLYKVEVNGQMRPVCGIGRRSRIDAYVCDRWPWHTLRQHDVFLALGDPLADTDEVKVMVDPRVTCGVRERSFKVAKSRSRAVQANQVGYLPDGPKIAYLGCWLGSYPDANAFNLALVESKRGEAYGKLPRWALRLDEAPAFHVEDVQTGKRVWSGRAVFRAAGDAPLKNSMGIRMNMSSLNVYDLDFSAFKTPGRYRLYVEGVGRSYDFGIADDIYVDAFRKQSTGVFAQRCGFALDPKHADGWRRIACHANGILASTAPRWETALSQGCPKFDELLEYVTDENGEKVPKKLHAIGGHHDAGDYNPRAHIDVAQRLFWAYELAPQKFYDGQLNIPEAGNGIPDILDEALWAVHLWEGLQDEDGGVYDGTESRGDPKLTETVEVDPMGDYAFAKGARGSFNAAGVFATSARLLEKFGQKEKAAEYIDRARRAFDWGVAHEPAIDKAAKPRLFSEFYTDPMLYAAAEIFHTTGEWKYHEIFLEKSLWRDFPYTEMETPNVHDRRLAAQSYLLIPRDKADAKTWDNVLGAMRREADYMAKFCEQRDYPFLTQPWVQIFWGFAAYQRFVPSTVTMWYLTGERKYFDRIVRNVDNTFGANPMSLSWVVGIGTETVRAPLHNSHWRPAGLSVVGTQVEGPVYKPTATSFSYPESVYPATREDFASMNSFVDAHFAVEMDEGVVNGQAETMAVLGLLCPDHK